MPKLVASFLGVFAALFAGSAKASAVELDASDEIPQREGGPGEVQRHAFELARILGLSNEKTQWLVRMHLAQADSESGRHMNPAAANRTASERAASKRLFFAERSGGTNAEKLGAKLGRDISSDERWYFPGSGGWFGLFPVNLLNILGGRSARSSDGFGPRWVYDPWAATVGYAAYCDGLTRRAEWSRSTQDARAMKAGGAAGSLMDDPHKDRYQKAVSNLDRAISRQGIPTSFRTDRPGIRQIYAGRNWLEVYREGKRRGF